MSVPRGQYTNRLIHEKSPYLLQHAHNPVDWFPWGDEAFELARNQDKPIFLSIGYATCHWCHVMEKECFENLSIAKLMNESFINIKVDREELPEVDSLYMECAQAIIPGGGGWPLNVLLTPELQPFFAATYIPAESGKGFIGLSELILRLKEMWLDVEEREKLMEQANRLMEVFKSQAEHMGADVPSKMVIPEMAGMLFQMADPLYGGIKGEPKFPMGYHCNFLLHYTKTSSESRALFYVDLTLEMMHRGGTYDHLGGGFSRYSIDSQWLIPHFEKMLYDNAILADSYLEAWLFTKKPLYREVCEEILHYMLRDMLSPEGAFYSAEDADSEGKEGLFYTWTTPEVEAVLGAKEAALFCEYFNVRAKGDFDGRSVLHMKESEGEFAIRKQMPLEALKKRLSEQKKLLWEARKKRPHPIKDDKILCAWNALAAYTLIESSKAFNNPRYLTHAQKVIHFIRDNLWKDGHLLRRWRQGEARFSAGLDEYAFLIHALLSLFEVDGEAGWLVWAQELALVLFTEFKAEGGAFYLTNGKDPNIVLRQCEFYDGSEPSGNGVHCENLLRLYQITAEENYLTQAQDIFKAAKKAIDQHPIGCCYHLIALQRYYDHRSSTIVVSLNAEEEHYSEIRELLFTHSHPHQSVIWRRVDNQQLLEHIPYLQDMPPLQDKTTLYICHRGECKKPLTEWSEIVMALT